MSYVRWIVCMLVCGGLLACGGGAGEAGGGAAVPTGNANSEPNVPEPSPLAGLWRDGGRNPQLLLVPPTGPVYVVLFDDTDTVVLRGTPQLADLGELHASAFDAVSLGGLQAPQQFMVGGTFIPGTELSLNRVPDGDNLITAQHDALNATHTTVSRLAGSSEVSVYLSGQEARYYALSVDAGGSLQMTNQMADETHCQATGHLIATASSALMTVELRFTGAPCAVPTGTVVKGLAFHDPGLTDLSLIGMDEGGTIGMFLNGVHPAPVP